MTKTELPNDIDYLKESLIEQHQANLAMQAQINKLLYQIEQLQRLLFGQKSEKRKTSKSNLDNELIYSSPKKQITAKATQKEELKRSLPDNLPRCVIKLDLSIEERACTVCYSTLHCIGKEVCEQLDYIPAQLMIKEYRRYKYGCNVCKGCIKTAPMPAQPIDKGLAGPGLLAEILVSKYQDCLPLYRQQKRWERLGYTIARSTQCDWVAHCALLLSPLVKRMEEKALLISPKIHTDDTPFPVLSLNKTHTGRMWVYVGGGQLAPKCAIYRYSKTRSKVSPR